MAYRLYGTRRSGAAMVELALAEAGVEYEFVRTGLGKGAKESDSYLAVNPTGKLPALETPEGEILTESAAILLTLADRYPGAGLLPRRGGPARARAIRWTVFVAAEIYPMIEIVDYPERFAEKAAAKTLRERARARIRRRWLTVESNVRGNPWLDTRGPSTADLAIANVSRWSTGKRWRQDNCPGIEAIAAALSTRDSTRDVWQRHFGG
ncbi:MAG: glutathione S-transferase family protein [Gammaproteobacteria bacterium]